MSFKINDKVRVQDKGFPWDGKILDIEIHKNREYYYIKRERYGGFAWRTKSKLRLIK